MIIKFFKRDKPIVKASIFLLAAICWLPVLFIPIMPVHYEDSIFQLIFSDWINNRVFVYVAGVLLLSFQAYVINNIASRRNIYGFSNNLLAFFYILLQSVMSYYWGFHPILFANVFLVLGLSRLLRINDQLSVNNYIFDSAFLFALAALIYLPLVILLLLPLIALFILRQAKWREFIVAFIGICLPFLLFYVISFLLGKTLFFYDYFHLTHLYTFHLSYKFYYLLVAIVVFFIAINYVVYFLSLNKYTIRVRNIHKVILWLFVFQILSVFITNTNYLGIALLLAIPASFILPTILLGQKRRLWISELIVLLFVLYSLGFLFLYSGILKV